MARDSEVAEIEWKILSEIESSDTMTQRGLSQKLGLALGGVNFHLKRMVRKGYIKMTTMPPNRAIYFVTPGGISRKIRLTYQYMVGTLTFYREARQRSLTLFQQLESAGIRRIAFLGARDLAEISFLSLQETSLELVGIYDSSRQGEKFLGHEVSPEAELECSLAERIIYTKQEWSSRGRYKERENMVFIF